ncbi:MAG: hypothetical protein ACYSUK_01305 [Planctomycetota bacterium]|jgi:hypothetical protein
MKQKFMCVLLCFSILFMSSLPMGCAGRKANPIPTYIPGDENLSCRALATEMSQIQTDMKRLRPKTNKFGTNVFWGVAGFFLIFPFFFMDFKDAEKIEYDALDRRRDHLMVLATEKNCNLHMINSGTISAQKAAPTEDGLDRKTQRDALEAARRTRYCTNCGKSFTRTDPVRLYKLKRVCPECLKKLKT